MSVPAPSSVTIWIDPEQQRILGALFGVLARMFAHGQQVVRDGDGSGWVDERAWLRKMVADGWQSSEKTLRKYLPQGDGVLWDWDEQHERIYLYSPLRLTKRGKLKGKLNVVQMALDAGCPELVITNLPGVKLVEVPFAGSMKQWYGNVLNAWHVSRAGRTTNISRYTLTRLWGVTTKTLISWEREAGINVIACYTQYTDDEQIPVKHAFPYLVERPLAGGKTVIEVRAKARHSNVYDVPTLKERQHRRAPHERRRAARLVLEAALSDDSPNGACGATTENLSRVGFSEPTGRRNFSTSDGNPKKAFSSLKAHFDKHPDDHAPHFVRIDADPRRGYWLYEQSSNGRQQTGVDEQLARRRADPWFADHGGRGAIVAAWREWAE